jgi:hypothetical protein
MHSKEIPAQLQVIADQLGQLEQLAQTESTEWWKELAYYKAKQKLLEAIAVLTRLENQPGDFNKDSKS